jgi:hypothetical protein
MKESICGLDCANCRWKNTCSGCSDEKCFIAKYIKTVGKEKYEQFKQTLIREFNNLGIPGMPKINELNTLAGKFVNLEYLLPNGETMKFLDDNGFYLGNQVPCEFRENRYYGLIADMDFLMVAEYGENGTDPEIVIYKRR